MFLGYTVLQLFCIYSYICNVISPVNYVLYFYICRRWRSWLRHCATSRKVAGSILDGVIEFFH
jgi:hypothetical protein